MITLAGLFLWLIFGSKNTANIRVQKRGPTWVSAKSFSSSGAFLGPGFGPVLEPVLEPRFGAIPGFGWELQAGPRNIP